MALPWLSGPAVRRWWSAPHVAEAFGDLVALIDAYGAVADWRPGLSARVLWPLLAEFLDEPVAELRAGTGETTEQVWFAGAHSDVGGGYAEVGLSDIALKWMLEKADQAGLTLDQGAVAAYPIAPDPAGKLHVSKKGLYVVTKGDPGAVARQHSDADADRRQGFHP